jgi:hypothetical protein
MSRAIIHQQIEFLLNKINALHTQIAKRNAPIPHNEMETMMQDMRQLYEAMLLLYQNNAVEMLDEMDATALQKILADKRAAEMKQAEVISVEPPIVVPVVSNEIETEEVVEKTEIKKNPQERIKKPSRDINSSLFEDKPKVGDKFQNENTLRSKIASHETNKTLGDKLHQKRITDLKAAIGINEKFLFINKLFDGNAKEYSEAIEKINAMDGLQSAQDYANELSAQLGWNSEDKNVKDFFELIGRRFIS